MKKTFCILLASTSIGLLAGDPPERRIVEVISNRTSELGGREDARLLEYNYERGKAGLAYRTSSDLEALSNAWKAYYDYVLELDQKDAALTRNGSTMWDFEYFMASMRMMNIYLHLGSKSKALEVLRSISLNPKGDYNYAMDGLLISEKALIMVHSWRYIEEGKGTPDWESESIGQDLLEIIRRL